MMDRRKPAQPDTQTLADWCLQHLVDNPEELANFMATTGYSPAALQRSVHEAGFQRGLIDYFAANEPLLLAVCASHAIVPESFMRVWARLNPAG